MYLVGELDDRDWFKGCGHVKIKKTISKEDLGKTKINRHFQIINLDDLTFFDPEKNEWIKFDKEAE